MIPVYFDPAGLPEPEKAEWWKKWKPRAEAATAKALDAFETWLAKKDGSDLKIDFDSNVWKDLKLWLLSNVFHYKCAYCECQILGFPGDAEHYRPKGNVKRRNPDDEFEVPLCRIDDPATGTPQQLKHPGYFWLAYDWRNLIPACESCNSGQGKNDRFDIGREYVVLMRMTEAEVEAIPAVARPRQSRRWAGYYYLAPGWLDAVEDPLLLNPLNPPADRKPHRHLRFGVRGIAAPVEESRLGATSIETFQLANERLRQARQKAQAEFQDHYLDALRRADLDEFETSPARKVLDDYRRGDIPFSAAALDYHPILLKKLGLAPIAER